MSEITFICECDTPERHTCLVVDHDGTEALVRYCEGCIDLAIIDWTGETASISIVAEQATN